MIHLLSIVKGKIIKKRKEQRYGPLKSHKIGGRPLLPREGRSFVPPLGTYAEVHGRGGKDAFDTSCGAC